MPTTPTPGPPQRPCSWRASALHQPTTGLVRPVAHAPNSRDTQAGPMARAIIAGPGTAPGTPKRTGSTAVQPSSTTRSESGKGSCREREGQYGEITVDVGS